MNIEQQIKVTEEELNAYKSANFACPDIIEWLESVLESFYRLNDLML